MKDPGEQMWREGRRRLRDWLPAARAEAARPLEGSFVAESSIAKAMIPHVTEDKLDAVLIYPAPLGGWHGDVVMKNLPLGVMNTLGTPQAAPPPTREMAEKHARGILENLLRVAKKNRESPPVDPPGPAFVLFDHGFTLKADALAMIHLTRPTSYTEQRAMEYMGELIAKFLPKGLSDKAFDALSHNEQAALWSAMHVLASFGEFRYPARVDASPSGHVPSEQRH